MIRRQISIIVLWVISLNALGSPITEDGDKNPEATIIQEKLLLETGVRALNPVFLSSKINLEAFRVVLTVGMNIDARKKLTNIRYIIADESISIKGVEAFYSNDLQALILGKVSDHSNGEPNEQLYHAVKLISHEVGHAFALSALTALSLATLANRFGPWQRALDELLEGLYSKYFFNSHPYAVAPAGSISQLKNVPSRYALQNIHEWFAECFSVTVTSHLEKKGIFGSGWSPTEKKLRPVSPAFQYWFHQHVLN